jgi:hypothetical protein
METQVKQNFADAPSSPSSLSNAGGAMTALDLAKWILMSRQMLDNHIGRELFADPALNILLDLYVNLKEGRAVPTSSACIASGVPTTTALRWINVLSNRRMLLKRAHPSDRRFTYLELSPEAIESIETYLQAVRQKLNPARAG